MRIALHLEDAPVEVHLEAEDVGQVGVDDAAHDFGLAGLGCIRGLLGGEEVRDRGEERAHDAGLHRLELRVVEQAGAHEVLQKAQAELDGAQAQVQAARLYTTRPLPEDPAEIDLLYRRFRERELNTPR